MAQLLSTIQYAMSKKSICPPDITPAYKIKNDLPTLTPVDISREQNAYTEYADVRGEIEDEQKRPWKMITG